MLHHSRGGLAGRVVMWLGKYFSQQHTMHMRSLHCGVRSYRLGSNIDCSSLIGTALCAWLGEVRAARRSGHHVDNEVNVGVCTLLRPLAQRPVVYLLAPRGLDYVIGRLCPSTGADGPPVSLSVAADFPR